MRAVFTVLALTCAFPARAGDSDRDGIPNNADACKDERETINGWKDDDGCPDELGSLEVLVLDLEGSKVEDAIARIDDVRQKTDRKGTTVFLDLVPERTVSLVIQAPGFAEWTQPDTEIVQGSAKVVATLDWMPVKVRVQTRDAASHEPLATRVRADGPGFVESQPTSPDGVVELELRPGTWTFRVESDHHETVSRELTLAATDELQEPVIELRPDWMTLADLDLSFPAGSATIPADRGPALDKVAATFFAFPDVAFTVIGHPDPREQELSLARAEAVRDKLVEAGVPAYRLTAKGLGTARPLATRWHPVGEAWNRSVALVVSGTAEDNDAKADLEGLAASVLRFAPGAARIDPAQSKVLAHVGERLVAHPTWRVELVGRRDTSDEILGQQRAEATAAWLVAKGVPAELVVADHGEPSPTGLTIRPATTEAATGAFTLPHELYFRPGSDQLIPESAPLIEEIAALLRAHPQARVRVLGHTAADEPDNAGTVLSEKRAELVRRGLAASGVEPGRMSIGAVGTRLPSLLPPGVTGIGGRVSFALLPPPLLDLPIVIFATGSDKLDNTGASQVARLAALLKSRPGMRVKVHGHGTLADGGERAQLALRRATGVVTTLLQRGANPAQVEPAWSLDDDRSLEPRVEVEVMVLPLEHDVVFDATSSELNGNATAELDLALRAALAATGQRLEIVGRAGGDDETGDLEGLARDRAEVVASWLIEHGVAVARLRSSAVVGGAHGAADRRVRIKVAR